MSGNGELLFYLGGFFLALLCPRKKKQECIPVGCVPSSAMAVWGGVCPSGCLPGGGVCSGKVCQGVFALRGVCPGGCTPHPLCEQMTDGCKNITFPQLPLPTVQNVFIGGSKGVLGAGTTYYCSISFIFMQISRKTFPNNRSLLQTQSLAPLPPSGKSWIRHCYCQVREWLEDILKLYATTISLVPRRKSH